MLKSIDDLNKSLEEKGYVFEDEDDSLVKSGLKSGEISNEDEDEEDPEVEGTEGEEEEEEESEGEGKEGNIKKSFINKPEISGAIEVSEFLAVVTESVIESLDSMEKSIKALAGDVMIKSLGSADNDLIKGIDALAKANLAILSNQGELGDLVKSMGDALGEMSDRLENLEAKPNMRKSVSNINVHPKNFNKSLGGSGNDLLTKSQQVVALTDMVQRGDPLVTVQDVISVESGAPMRPELVHKVKSYYNQ